MALYLFSEINNGIAIENANKSLTAIIIKRLMLLIP